MQVNKENLIIAVSVILGVWFLWDRSRKEAYTLIPKWPRIDPHWPAMPQQYWDFSSNKQWGEWWYHNKKHHPISPKIPRWINRTFTIAQKQAQAQIENQAEADAQMGVPESEMVMAEDIVGSSPSGLVPPIVKMPFMKTFSAPQIGINEIIMVGAIIAIIWMFWRK